MGGLANCLSIVNYIQSCLNHISSNFTFLNDYIEYISQMCSFSYNNNNICKKRQNIDFYDSTFMKKKTKNNNGIVKHFNNHNHIHNHNHNHHNNNNNNIQEDDWGWFVVLD